MAENKTSFLLYCDYIDMFKKLPDEIAGKLIKHIFEYTNDLDPQTDDLLLEIAFEPIKKQLKRDLRKYEGVVEEKSTGGKIGNLKRWHNDIYKEFLDKKISLEAAILKAKNRTISVSDKEQSHPIASIAVIDTVTDTVVDTDTVIGKVINSDNTISFPESEKSQVEVIKSEPIKPIEVEKKKSSAKKRKEQIFPECKQYFLDYYKDQKGVDFYWTAAEATALNQLIQKIRTISNESDDNKLKDLFFTFIGKIKAADDWVYENLSIKIMNSKFNELIPKMKSVNAAGLKSKIPNGYEALLQKHQNIIKNGKS